MNAGSRRRDPRGGGGRLHLASWNVDGIPIGPASRRRRLPDVSTELGGPDVLCLQELRLRDRDRDEVRAAEDALPGWALYHSFADDRENAAFRGGRTYGVGTFVRRELEAVPLPRPTWDREGRITTILLPAWRLAVVNVYAVNGTDKPYFDHDQGCYAGDRHQWKRRFHDHVADSARALREQGLDLMLIGYWNVSQQRLDTTPRLRTEGPHALSRLHFREAIVDALDVVDVFRALHPDAARYTWFHRRARGPVDAARVDIALLSRGRMGEVTAATIDDALVPALGSDHAPIHVELASATFTT